MSSIVPRGAKEPASSQLLGRFFELLKGVGALQTLVVLRVIKGCLALTVSCPDQLSEF